MAHFCPDDKKLAHKYSGERVCAGCYQDALLQIGDLKRMLQIGYGFLQHEHRDPKVFNPGCFKCEVWKTFTPKEEFQKVPQAHVTEKQKGAI
jgi:hypothetical protein